MTPLSFTLNNISTSSVTYQGQTITAGTSYTPPSSTLMTFAGDFTVIADLLGNILTLTVGTNIWSGEPAVEVLRTLASINIQSLASTPSNTSRVVEPVKLAGDTQEGSVLDTNIWMSTPTGSASLTLGHDLIQLNTGTTANSSQFLASTRKGRFISRTTNAFISNVLLGDTGTTNNIRRWGAYDANNGVYFQLDGTLTLGIRKTGIDTHITTFNGPSPIVVDTNFHLYEIQYEQGLVLFYQDNNLIHTVTATTTSLFDTPHLKIGMENTNSGGGTSNVYMQAMGAVIMRYGTVDARPKYFHSSYNTRVQSQTAQSNGNLASLTATINPTTAGNLLVVTAIRQGGALTISDSASQTYGAATSQTNGSSHSYIFYVANCAAGVTSVTITCSPASTDDMCMIVTEYNSVNTTSPLDKTATNTATGTSWTSTSTATTTNANELLVGAAFDKTSASATYTAGTGWSAVNTIAEGPGKIAIFQEDQYVSSTGAYAATGTSSGSDSIAAAIATFIMPSYPPVVTPNSPMILKRGPGTLNKIMVNSVGTGGASVTLYDSLTGSGSIMAVVSLSAGISNLNFDMEFDNGLTIVINSTTADFTVVYD